MKSKKKPKDFKPETHFPDDDPRWPGKPRCQGWAVTTQGQCEKTPLKGRKWCKRHGGAVPTGIANGQFRHGRYSKSLSGSKSLADLYHENLEREGHHSLIDEIVITDARLQQLYEAAAPITADLMMYIDGIREVYEALSQSVSKADVTGVAANLKELGRRIDLTEKIAAQKLGLDQQEDRLFERRRRLVETDSRREIAVAQTITIAQLVAIFANLGFEIRELFNSKIDDRDMRQMLLVDIDRIVQKFVLDGGEQ